MTEPSFNQPITKVAFDYIKSSLFRVIHCDGVIGGPTPSGYIHATLFSERVAIPQRLVHEVLPNGQLGEPVQSATQSREAVVREMDVDVVMSVATAEMLIDWLTKRVAEVKSINLAGERLGVEDK